MGLDMYLSGKRYLSSYFNKGDDEKAEQIAELFPEIAGRRGRFNTTLVKEIKVELGYWRKANAIHQWFVDNCQGGEDNCGYYDVGREQLKELREICQTVLEDRDRARELLPPQGGFFFGSTDINDYYFDDLKQTIEIIDQALAMPEFWDLEYHSSW